jgi:23S rRNA pseudouridine1911/1915/1917 synthase
VRVEVSAEAAGERLDVFLGGHVGSRAAAQRLIDAGRVRVDGAERAKRYALRAGEVVEVLEVEAAPAGSPVPAAEYAVAWEDEHLVVVDKPAGVVVHPGRAHEVGTLAQALAERGVAGGEEGRPGIVHRLDRDTSGLLVVARSEEVHAALKAQLAAREIVREYLALVAGRPSARTGTIEAPLGRDRRVRTRISTDTAEGRAAVTHFETERAYEGWSLLRVRLETGRTHQIRAHLKAIGHPVAGDPEYGRAGALGLERQFLHAERLAFDHPVTGERVDVRSELPADLRQALDELRLGGAARPGRPRPDLGMRGPDHRR